MKQTMKELKDKILVENINDVLVISVNGVKLEYFKARIEQSLDEPTKLLLEAPFITK